MASIFSCFGCGTKIAPKPEGEFLEGSLNTTAVPKTVRIAKEALDLSEKRAFRAVEPYSAPVHRASVTRENIIGTPTVDTRAGLKSEETGAFTPGIFDASEERFLELLIVEDEEVLSNLAQLNLKASSNSVAKAPKAFIDQILRKSFDMVQMDLQVPLEEGAEIDPDLIRIVEELKLDRTVLGSNVFVLAYAFQKELLTQGQVESIATTYKEAIAEHAYEGSCYFGFIATLIVKMVYPETKVFYGSDLIDAAVIGLAKEFGMEEKLIHKNSKELNRIVAEYISDHSEEFVMKSTPMASRSMIDRTSSSRSSTGRTVSPDGSVRRRRARRSRSSAQTPNQMK